MGLTLLDRANRVRINACAGLREFVRWQIAWRKPAGVQVFYGFDHLPARGEKAGGGIIKCQDLADLYPNDPHTPGLLYLVSSSLPPAPVNMVKLAKRRGVKFVLNQNGVAYPAWHGPGWAEANRGMKQLVAAADHVIYQSRFCKRAADWFLGECSQPCEVLYNPVDTRVFTPGESRTAPGDQVVLLLAGSLGQSYRLQAALETLAVLRKQGWDAHLIVAGRLNWDRDPKACGAAAAAMAVRLGVQQAIEWVGPYSQEESASIYRRAHLLLHPTYNDVCPRVVVEALACGLPVVYSASGGVPELVGPGAGCGVPAPEDWDNPHAPPAAELAGAVGRILPDWGQYARAARERAVSALDVRPWLRRHGEIFAEISR